MKDAKQRLEQLTNKADVAGLTPEEKLERTALVDQISGGAVKSAPVVDPQRVQERAHGRRSAEAIITLMKEVAIGLISSPGGAETRGAAIDSFWREIREAIPPDPRITETKLGPMSHAEADRWAETRLTFGKHKDEKVRLVPLEYLQWLESHEEEFHRDLSRYLRAVENQP